MMPTTTRPEDGLLLLGDSGAMTALRREIASAAKTHAKVILLGETGVGKEVVARLIHAASPRAWRSLIAVNCSGIPETLLESELFGHVRGSFTGAFRDKPGLVQLAHRGTLFLDELGEMSLRMQAVLLRFAETGEVQPVGAGGPVERVDVRLITATNCNLAKQVEAGAFRQDLYYRLNVIRIEIPPLRMRDRDMVMLMTHFLRQASAEQHRPSPELTAAASEAITQYAWPGNIREVKNVAERIVARQGGPTVGVENLPAEIRCAICVSPHASADSESSRCRSCDRLPAAALPGSHVANRLFAQLRSGKDFWSVVYRPFKAHDLMRADVIALVDLGLRETSGSYRGLLALFNLVPADYKRFLAFLYQYDCNLPVSPYRRLNTAASDPGIEAAS